MLKVHGFIIMNEDSGNEGEEKGKENGVAWRMRMENLSVKP